MIPDAVLRGDTGQECKILGDTHCVGESGRFVVISILKNYLFY